MICKRNEYNEYIKLIDLDQLGITEDQIIVLSLAGSRMYGTSNENSDIDFLGIYKPTRNALLTGNLKHHISLPKSSGIDLQMWSIHYFLKLACDGETMAIDLLHAPYDCWMYWNPNSWGCLTENRHSFYTKGMKAFVSYARKQAAKYGVKGDRINALENVIKILNDHSPTVRLKQIWDCLPNGEHLHFLDAEPYKMYQVCGIRFQETVTVGYIKEHLTKTLTEYGKRAMMAANSEGIDWKAMSHAIRAGNQIYDILTVGLYNYPLKNRKFITMVKEGKIDYTMAEAVLEDFISEIEKLIETSKLPEEVNKKYWKNWLLTYIDEEIL